MNGYVWNKNDFAVGHEWYVDGKHCVATTKGFINDGGLIEFTVRHTKAHDCDGTCRVMPEGQTVEFPHVYEEHNKEERHD